LFATGQFWIGFLRDEPVDLFGLGQAQIVGALLLVVSLLAIAWIGRRRRRSKHRPGQVSAEFHGS
jgi:prolipoprotein diacylglyceryltransferase